MTNEKRNTEQDSKSQGRFPLRPLNYKLLCIGVLVIILGFVLMSGGQLEDPTAFNPEIFNFRRITLAPMLVLAGFLFEIFAIMYRGKKSDSSEEKH